MKKFRFIFISAMTLVAVFFISCSSTKAAKNEHQFTLNPDVVSGKLDNGMSYYVLKNDYPVNRISLRLVVKVGSIAETESELGLAHFIEHMCFNGTENFAKNSLIDYAESIGMDFGAEVNAYTSFEETVYKLEIPADNKEFLETALLIFHDWASAVTFDPEELEKERGVVTEEWRGRLGLSGRLADAVLPFELKDSPYVDRLPIGSMDVIQNITRDEVISFYKKWYQPQNMAVVISGYVDPKVAEWLIQEKMGSIPAAKTKNTPAKGYVPARTEKDVLIFADPEWTTPQFQIVSLDEENKPITGESDMRRYYLKQIVNEALNARLSEITTDPQSPWLTATTVSYSETHSAHFDGYAFIPKEDMAWDSFARIIDEIDRLLLHGITQSEFERVRDSLLASENQWYDQSETTSSLSRVSDLCNYFIIGDIPASDDDFIEVARRVLDTITVEDANKRAKELFEGRGNLCIIYLPQAQAEQMPSKEEIIDFWENYQSAAEIQAYEESVSQGNLMERPATKASVTSKREIPSLKTNEYILSNGVRLLVKKTDYDKSKIYMSALSMGGLSLISDKEYSSALFSPSYAIYSGLGGMDINQLQKYLSDKAVSFNVVIDEREEKIVGQTSPAELETLLQLVNQLMTAPQFTETGANYINLLMSNQAKQYNVQPADVFNSEISKILYGNSIRHLTGISPELVAAFDSKDAERIFKERFANAADFTFVFSGDIDEDALVELCCYYLGTMPSNQKLKESGKYEPYSFPKGITEAVVKKGQEDKGKVFIGFGGKLPAAKDVNETYKDISLMNQLCALVDIRLREIIREDKSGTYNVSVNTVVDGYPERFYEFQISFGCEPAREKELVKEVMEALNTLRSQEIDQSYIDKINELYRRNFEANQYNSSWWLEALNAVEVYKYMPLEAAYDDTSVIRATTAQSMKELAAKYINPANYTVVYLQPEN